MSVYAVTLFLSVIAPSAVFSFSMDSSIKYLSRYGYLPDSGINVSQLVDSKLFSLAVSKFQKMANLPVTGNLDSMTQQFMSLPRCGIMDEINGSQKFVLASKWEKKFLTYKIVQYSSKLNRDIIDRELSKAFNIWQKNSALTFRKVPATDRADIEIRFSQHGTNFARFDGPGGTLAYAYFPQNGDVYFDESENWSVGARRGISLFHVALHELGHSLGLAHTNVRNAVMFPFYKNTYTDLESDDIAAIHKLYGNRPVSSNNIPRTTRRPNTNAQRPNTRKPPRKTNFHQDSILCKDPTIDTAFRTKEGKMYIFKGDNYWELTDKGLSKDFPQKISQNWIGLPPNIDAAFTFRKNTYFFKGHLLYVYRGNRMLPGYPKFIAYEFNGLPSYIDGATNWRGRSTIYFFKGSYLYSYDFRTKRTFLVIRDWQINGLQAVFQHKNGKTYFFKDHNVYRSDDISTPIPVMQHLFKCKVKGQKWKFPKKENKEKNPFYPPRKQVIKYS